MLNKFRPAMLILVIGALAFSLGYVVFPHSEPLPGDAHGNAGAHRIALCQLLGQGFHQPFALSDPMQ